MSDEFLTMSMFASRRDYDLAMSRRDLNPHKPAKLAMYLWPRHYADSGLGSMGYWDSLDEQQRDYCRRCVADVATARDEPPNAGIERNLRRQGE